MAHNLSVQVLDKNGRTIKGACVVIYIEGMFSGGKLEGYTGGEGVAEFKTGGDYESSRKLHIKVRGETFGPYRISGGSYTVQL